MKGGWLKACLHWSIDRSWAVHGNPFDANQKISCRSFDTSGTEAEWLVLAVCHGFVILGLQRRSLQPHVKEVCSVKSEQHENVFKERRKSRESETPHQ